MYYRKLALGLTARMCSGMALLTRLAFVSLNLRILPVPRLRLSEVFLCRPINPVPCRLPATHLHWKCPEPGVLAEYTLPVDLKPNIIEMILIGQLHFFEVLNGRQVV